MILKEEITSQQTYSNLNPSDKNFNISSKKKNYICVINMRQKRFKNKTKYENNNNNNTGIQLAHLAQIKFEILRDGLTMEQKSFKPLKNMNSSVSCLAAPRIQSPTSYMY